MKRTVVAVVIGLLLMGNITLVQINGPMLSLSYQPGCNGTATLTGVNFTQLTSIGVTQLYTQVGQTQAFASSVAYPDTDGAGSFTTNVTINGCGRYLYLATDSSGLTASVAIYASTTYGPIVGNPQYSADIVVGSTVSMQVDTTARMNPFNGSYRIDTYSSGTNARIIDGPQINADGVWYRIDTKWEISPDEVVEAVGWVNTSLYPLTVMVNIPIEPPVRQNLSGQVPQAESILEVVNLNMRRGPALTEPVVGKIPPGVIVTVLAKNETGTFLWVQLPSGVQGWTCELLTHNNLNQTTVPVLPGTGGNYCSADNIP